MLRSQQGCASHIEGLPSLDEQMMHLLEKYGNEACQASLQQCREKFGQQDKLFTNDNLDDITHELNRALLDASFEAAILSDAKGQIIKVNKTALTTLGYRHEKELLGKSVSIMVGGGEAQYHDEYFEKYKRRGMDSPHFGKLREVVAKRQDGSEFPCMIGIRKLSGQNSTLTVAFLRDITKEKQATEVAIQKRAAEELLMNVLPEEVAVRLQENPSHIADHFHTATILFADICSFTQMSSQMDAANLVAMLNDLFSRFDKRLEAYGLNKIKTIGDCYMVCSAPTNKEVQHMSNAACHFALDILEVVDEYNNENSNNDDRPLRVRVGMDCGPIVAGVIGTKRFLYDVWGHPVNVASRMESTGEPGRVQVTNNVVEAVPSDEFSFEPRGNIQVKGIGEMSTFFLNDRLKTRSKNYWSLLEPSQCPKVPSKANSTRLLQSTRIPIPSKSLRSISSGAPSN